MTVRVEGERSTPPSSAASDNRKALNTSESVFCCIVSRENLIQASSVVYSVLLREAEAMWCI